MRPQQGLVRSFRFAMDGFRFVVQTQRNFRIQLAIAGATVVAGAYLGLQAWEWVAVLIAATLVLVLEMVNTAFEASIDMVTRDYHPLAKSAKDVAAAAVLAASVGAVAVGTVVFWPHLAALLRERW